MKEIRKTRKFKNRKKWVTATTVTLGMSVGLVATNTIYNERVEAADTQNKVVSDQTSVESNVINNSSHLGTTKIPAAQVGALQQDSNRVYIHRYTEPTGVDDKGNFIGEQVISSSTDKQFTNPTNYETLGVVKKNNKVYYNIYDSENTSEEAGHIATIENPSSQQYKGYTYDDEFQKHVDPQRYSNSKGQVITDVKGKASVNLDATVPQQAYHIYYKNKDANQPTYELKSTDPNSYQFVFDWFEHDHGYYLGSTRINDYSKLTAKSLMLPYVANKNTNDYLVKAPKGYHFDVEATHLNKVVSGEYGIDSDTSSTGHPYLDLNNQVAKDFGNEKAYDTGVFHVNEWAQAMGGLASDQQNAKDLHIFRCYVTANKATKNIIPPSNELPSQQAQSLADPQSHLSDKDYRQVIVRIYDDDTGGVTAFQLPVKNGESLNVNLQDYVPDKYKNYKLDPGNPANSSKSNNDSNNYLIDDNFYKKYPDGITYFISNAPWAVNNDFLPVINLSATTEAAEKAKQEAAEKAKQEAAEKAKQEAAEKAKQEAAEKAKQEAAEKAKQEAAEKAKQEAAEKAKQEAAEKAKQEAAEKAKQEAAEKAKQEAAEKAKQEAAEKAKQEAAEKAKQEAAEKAKQEAAEKAKQEAAEKAKQEAAEKAKQEAAEKAKQEAAEKAKQEAAEKAKQEAAEKAKQEAAEKAKQEAAEKAKQEAAEKAKQEAAEKAKQEAAEKAKQEAAEKAKQEAAEKAKQEAAEKVKSVKLTHNAFVYNKYGKLVRKGLRIKVIKRGKLIKAVENAKVVKINGKKYYQIGRNQFIKVANTKIPTHKIHIKAKIKSRKHIKMYNRLGKFNKHYARPRHTYTFNEKIIIGGKTYYKIVGTNNWIPAEKLILRK